MTELQPTEVELTGKKKKHASVSRRKIVFFISVLVIILLAALLTVVMASRASHNPNAIQQQALPVSRADKTGNQ